MKRIKTIAFLLSLTSCLCLFGVGFSMWYNVNPLQPKKQTGALEAYDVLEISNTEMTTFKFSMLSFKEGDAQSTNFKDSDQGEITVTYTVGADTLAATDRTFRVDTALGYDENTVRGGYKNLFGDLPDGSISVECKAKSSNGETITITPVNEAIEENEKGVKEIKRAYEFKGVTANDGDSYSFTITYTFKIPSENDNFRKTFGQYLMGGETEGKVVTKFIASAYISKTS